MALRSWYGSSSNKPLQPQWCWRHWQANSAVGLLIIPDPSPQYQRCLQQLTAIREGMKGHGCHSYSTGLFDLFAEKAWRRAPLWVWPDADDHPDPCPHPSVLKTWNKPTASLHTWLSLPIKSLFLMCSSWRIPRPKATCCHSPNSVATLKVFLR